MTTAGTVFTILALGLAAVSAWFLVLALKTKPRGEPDDGYWHHNFWGLPW